MILTTEQAACVYSGLHHLRDTGINNIEWNFDDYDILVQYDPGDESIIVYGTEPHKKRGSMEVSEEYDNIPDFGKSYGLI